jgi:hypothetical protein
MFSELNDTGGEDREEPCTPSNRFLDKSKAVRKKDSEKIEINQRPIMATLFRRMKAYIIDWRKQR